jgi:hypothetical protein
MDLFVCGRHPLLAQRQGLACDRRQRRHFSNHCSHVPSGRVQVGADDQICPLAVLAPIHVLGSKRFIKPVAQNIIIVDDENTLCWADGITDIPQDMTETFIAPSPSQAIQDIWPEPDFQEFTEGLFDDEARNSRFGMLTRDGGIYSVVIGQEKEAPILTERTLAQNRKPFRHALLRQEANNMQGDHWPAVVFDEQPRIIYRLRTISDLISWLNGVAVSFSALEFPSQITQLLTCCGPKGEDCMALTEEGKVYHWRRDTPLTSPQTGILSETLQPASSTAGAPGDRPSIEAHEKMQSHHAMLLPPITKLTAGPTYGAAVTSTGQLYIFLTSRAPRNIKYLRAEPILSELYMLGSEPPGTAYDPYSPRLAQILEGEDRPQPTVIDVAVGYNHLVVLTIDGEVFTAGDGMQGQLGVGARQFDLHADMHQESEDEDEDAWEFAERWQKVEIAAEERARCGRDGGRDHASTNGEKRVVGVKAALDSTLLIMG